MKPSTAAELAGFVCLSVAGFLWRTIPVGFVATGVCLLLVGLATEDAAAALAFGRVVGPIRARHARRKTARTLRRTVKQAKAAS